VKGRLHVNDNVYQSKGLENRGGWGFIFFSKTVESVRGFDNGTKL
jgi:hypothetical protein